ncbi:hypothetical protein ANCDUO_27481 [Ancylostoma duodenale]|uniref:Uncharacterized protein n=1 Tax=Ancylostoma duodenale TaxID=51022 RepID=A0A0C2F6B3_9BILA|nr:hypothetical protein ANCDUO_27481 [Ancylostoma duodenale]
MRLVALVHGGTRAETPQNRRETELPVLEKFPETHQENHRSRQDHLHVDHHASSVSSH